jgi:hypothetical protein
VASVETKVLWRSFSSSCPSSSSCCKESDS